MDLDAYDAVVFDLDGTLVRLRVDWQAFRERLATFLDDDVLCDGPDRPATWTLSRLRERGDDAARRRVLEILRTFELAGASRSKAIPAGIEMFHRVNDGRPIAVVTNNTRGAAQEALRRHGLRPHVRLLVALEDVDRPKPQSEGLEIVLDRFDADAVLFVGDGDKDATAADRAGVDFVDVEDLGGGT